MTATPECVVARLGHAPHTEDPAPAPGKPSRTTRPKVERKIGHLMRRRHGGRRARVRGRVKVAADFSLLAAAVNLARLAVLGIDSTTGQPAVIA
ncbi:transposase [Nocardia sp. NBC_00565]|uniref:transposase n=1 Tax=Nocardia sp. NBC_00565 TaxID=2975993 RepID=UPI002E80FD83|nr:transposase [Nocardia sp. NBC_00565]WUC06844.1 transposase [Nocardia sp. NBC_00565]